MRIPQVFTLILDRNDRTFPEHPPDTSSRLSAKLKSIQETPQHFQQKNPMNKRKESEVFLKFPKAAQIHLRQNSGIQKKKCIKTKNSAS